MKCPGDDVEVGEEKRENGEKSRGDRPPASETPGEPVHQDNSEAVESEGDDMEPEIASAEEKVLAVEDQVKKRPIGPVPPNIVIGDSDHPLKARKILVGMKMIEEAPEIAPGGVGERGAVNKKKNQKQQNQIPPRRR